MKEETIEHLCEELYALESEMFEIQEASAALETELASGTIDVQSARLQFACLLKHRDKVELSMEFVESRLDELRRSSLMVPVLPVDPHAEALVDELVESRVTGTDQKRPLRRGGGYGYGYGYVDLQVPRAVLFSEEHVFTPSKLPKRKPRVAPDLNFRDAPEKARRESRGRKMRQQ